MGGGDYWNFVIMLEATKIMRGVKAIEALATHAKARLEETGDPDLAKEMMARAQQLMEMVTAEEERTAEFSETLKGAAEQYGCPRAWEIFEVGE